MQAFIVLGVFLETEHVKRSRALLAGRRPDPSNYDPLARIASRYAQLDEIIKKALAPASQRYGSSAEFANALGSVQFY
jgi:hypothetical protein